MKQNHPQEQEQAAGKLSSLQNAIEALERLPKVDQLSVLRATIAFLNIQPSDLGAEENGSTTTASSEREKSNGTARFTEDRTMSPKEFLLEKQPLTDVERVACLAYYLTHFRDQPHFKTLDLSKLNTEAAQIKFSNAAVAVQNAVKQSYLTSATRGNKQLSAMGEQFVVSLPDREAAKATMSKARRRRKKTRSKSRAA